jgi:tetratricopeptide (TPR) repeat protein
MAARERTTAEWLHEGRHWVEEGVYDAALECGQKALAQSPGDPQILLRMDKFCAEAFFSIALWLRRLGMLEDALLSLEDAKACGWDPEDVLLEMGEVHMELGHDEAAMECFGGALEIDQTLAHAWYGQAAAQRKLGRDREALPSIERSLQLHPTAAARWLRDVILDALREPER